MRINDKLFLHKATYSNALLWCTFFHACPRYSIILLVSLRVKYFLSCIERFKNVLSVFQRAESFKRII